jgi:tRNA threonylcarbamoyladenosine biosynthesis protein TsaB
MPYILNIETTTKNCSVAIAEDGKLIALEEINDGNYSHAEFLNPLIDAVLKKSNLNFKDLSAIAVSKGPGSYTGLRIGVSTAKGLCFALDLPLIAVDTLTVLSKSISVDAGYIIPMLDARRMEIYSAVFNTKNEIILPTNAVIIEENTFDQWLSMGEVHFVGDAVDKCATVIHHPNAVFHENTFPSAKDMSELSNEAFHNKNFEDLAYFEPYYLKDFIVTKKV